MLNVRWIPLILVLSLLPGFVRAEEEKKEEPATAKKSTEGMVLIPAGTVKMGTEAEEKPTNESPLHEVKVPAFYIDRFEVTNGEFAKFVAAKGYEKPEFWSEEGRAWLTKSTRKAPQDWEILKEELGEDFDRHPVTGVSWYEADAFARFVGKRLPTEVEWERAARGDDTRKFPWGDEFAAGRRVKPEGEAGRTYPVGANEADVSPFGVRDMGGNVSEWTSSWFGPYPGTKYVSRYWGEGAERRLKVARGGSWRFIDEGPAPAAHKCRVSFRLVQYPPDGGYSFFGFRLAQDADPEK